MLARLEQLVVLAWLTALCTAVAWPWRTGHPGWALLAGLGVLAWQWGLAPLLQWLQPV